MTPPALAKYRSVHKIEPVFVRDEAGFRAWDKWVCAYDGIRIHREADGGYKHDQGEVGRLAAIERGEAPVLTW